MKPLPFIWRSDAKKPAPNLWTYFRREFSWQPRDGTKIQFSADPTARLWINGHVVLPRVMRFVTPQITVETLDLSAYLMPGKNVAVVLHHHWGVSTFQRSPGGQPGVAIQSNFLKTDGRWKWKQAAEFLGHTHQTIGGGAQRIRFPVVLDTRRELRGLHQLGFKDGSWKSASPLSSPAWSKPSLKQTPRLEREELFPHAIEAAGFIKKPAGKPPLPEVDMSWRAKHASYTKTASAISSPSSLLSSDETVAELRAHRDGYLNLDFGLPVHGYLKIEIEDAAPGTTLDFLQGELRWNLHAQAPVLRKEGSFDPEMIVGTPVGDRIILRGGRQTIEIPEERTWRWLLIIWNRAAQPIRVRSVSVMTSQHPTQLLGSFSGGPSDVPQIIKLCLDHAKVTMSDTYVDTTGREDGQWLEDIQYRADLAARWFGDASLRQVTLQHAAEQQTPHGRFRVLAPEDFGAEGHMQNLDWGLTWIGLLYDDWKWTGETTRLTRYFPNLEKFLAVAATQTDGDGMLMDRTVLGDIRCALRAKFDWGEQESTPNAWYYGFLQNAIEIAETLGKPQRAAQWKAQAAKLQQGFPRFLSKHRVAEVWSPQKGVLGFGQGATVSAAFYGILSPRQRAAALASAFLPPNGSPPKDCKRWNNPTYAYRALKSLCDYGMGHLAGKHFLERYRPYLPDGPLPEYFIPGTGQCADPTGSHGWAAVPLLWLHDTVLGVRTAEAGGKKLLWKPTDIGWPEIEGTTMTPRGPCQVKINWRRKIFELTPPAGVTVKRALP